MNSQHYTSMRVLSRTTASLEDALESLEFDGLNLAYTERGEALPYYSKMYITEGNVEEFFKITHWAKYTVKIFVFEDHEERVDFLLTEKQTEK